MNFIAINYSITHRQKTNIDYLAYKLNLKTVDFAKKVVDIKKVAAIMWAPKTIWHIFLDCSKH